MESREFILKKISVFLVLTFLLSSIFYHLIISAETIQARSGIFVFALMWCPGIAGLLTRFYFHKTISGLGWRVGKIRYQLSAYSLPILYAFIVYSIVWLTGLGGFYNQEFLAKITARLVSALESDAFAPGEVITLYLLVLAILGVISHSFSTLGEEIGWRGFLVPELAKIYSYKRVSVISGGIWLVWHLPILLFADYNSEAPVWFSLICFSVMIIAISFAFAWFRLKSDSLWTAVFMHASHNVFIQQFFTPFTYDTGSTAYFIDEFGVGLALVTIPVAYFFWKRREILDEF